MDELLERIGNIGRQLKGYTEKLVFSFIDISSYRKGQRKACGCIVSKDIGAYNTCPHLCRYCYANASPELALANWRRHRMQPLSPAILPESGEEP